MHLANMCQEIRMCQVGYKDIRTWNVEEKLILKMANEFRWLQSTPFPQSEGAQDATPGKE
jgi:hypothetical protein